MSLFNFNTDEILTFFAVLVRFTVLFSVLPFIGDRFVPSSVKVLLGLAVSFALFPSLVASGQIKPQDADVWGSSASGIIGVIALETLFSLALGFTARLVFEGISFGANLVGTFMGFASASMYDPHQESQSEVVAQIQTSLAMLIFLALDGHHLMLRASLESYRIVGLGRAQFLAPFSHRLIQMTGEVFKFGLQISAPVAISLFAVNVVFGMISKAMPQLNILILSFAITASIGFIVMFLSMPEFNNVITKILGGIGDWMVSIMLALSGRR